MSKIVGSVGGYESDEAVAALDWRTWTKSLKNMSEMLNAKSNATWEKPESDKKPEPDKKPDSDKNDEEDEEKDDDEWEDITHCVFKPQVTLELQIAGGGSHAWSYVLTWNDSESDQPRVLIKNLEGIKDTDKTAIIRHQGRCSGIKLVDFDEELPEDTDEVTYSPFICPKNEDRT